MLKSRTLVRLILVAVLLAIMVVPLMGATVGHQAGTSSTTIQAGAPNEQPAAVIACNTGDPGTSGGGCGGG
ncbi:MAG: hypothetical protein WAM60_00310 [Candidatus Promineifilaceae bacterium]